MILRIPENIDAKERRRLLLVLPILHAMKKYKNKAKAAEYLGVSPSYIGKLVRIHNELAYFNCTHAELRMKQQIKLGELYTKRRRMNRIYPDK